MKITIPVHHFPPRYMAGAELYSYRIAQWLQKRGHTVEVVCIESIDTGTSDRLEVQQDLYNNIPVWRLSFNIFTTPERRKWEFDNPLLADWFRNYATHYQPDIVHFQAGYLLGIAPLHVISEAHIPMVLTLHDYWFLCPRTNLQRTDGQLCHSIPDTKTCAWCRKTEDTRYFHANRISAGAAGWAMRTFSLQNENILQQERRQRVLAALQIPDAVIAPSQFLARLYAPYVAPQRLHIIRGGLDVTLFENVMHTESEALRIGFIGQIAEYKGVHILVDAFRQLQSPQRPLELHIYGGLDVNSGYVREVRKLAQNDPRIIFHGRFQNTEIADVLGGLDVLVVPSICFENSPLTIGEAQAAATPVITSRLGGMAEKIRHDIDGLLFNAGDVQDLRHSLQRCIDEPDLLPHLGAAIRMPATIDEEMKHMFDIYATLIPELQLNS